MSDLTLKTAIANYGHTKALKDGTTNSERFSMEHFEITPVPMIFRRMVRELEFDVAEMALSTFFCAKAHGKKFTGLPIFLTRDFYHGTTAYNVKSGIQSPTDLAGRKVGVRSYTFTPGVWTRGILASEYGLDLDSVTWVISGDEHVAEYEAPSNVVYSESNDLAQMLLSGEVDATIGAGPIDSPDVKPLFANPSEADTKWAESTGLYPVSHMLVVRDETLESNPWLVEELFSLFKTAKDDYLKLLNSGEASAPADQKELTFASMVGGDSIQYGYESTRKTLETFVGFNVAQKVIPEAIDPQDLFLGVELG